MRYRLNDPLDCRGFCDENDMRIPSFGRNKHGKPCKGNLWYVPYIAAETDQCISIPPMETNSQSLKANESQVELKYRVGCGYRIDVSKVHANASLRLI